MAMACESARRRRWPRAARALVAGAALTLAAGASPPYPPITLQAQPPHDTGANLGSTYLPAPVPDPDYQVPSTGGRASGQPVLRPYLYRPRATTQGEGFTPGSTIQGEERRRFKPVPSLNLSVPLE